MSAVWRAFRHRRRLRYTERRRSCVTREGTCAVRRGQAVANAAAGTGSGRRRRAWSSVDRVAARLRRVGTTELRGRGARTYGRRLWRDHPGREPYCLPATSACSTSRKSVPPTRTPRSVRTSYKVLRVLPVLAGRVWVG